MAKQSQTTHSKSSDPEDTIHIDLDFDFKFYASPQAKELLQRLSQVFRWLLPFLLAFSTLRSVGVAPGQLPPTPQLPAIEAEQSPQEAP